LVSMTWRFMLAEKEYLCTFHLTTQIMHNAPQVPNPPFLAAPQPQLMYVPAWPTAQLGPLTPMPLTQPAPPAPFPVPPLLLCPLCQYPQSHHQWHHHSTSVTPLAAGARCPTTIWPLHSHIQLVTHWVCGHPISSTTQGRMVMLKRIQTAKPDKFTGQDPLKLHPFIVSYIMAFDS